MDDLAVWWNKLSLSGKECKKFELLKKKDSQEYALAAKFLTKRSVNIDAVAKTF